MTTARPTTATILFSDLVNSTELLQRVGDETAQRVFETHHRLLRDAVVAHGGAEVKWTGDGLMVAFDSATSAVRGAIAMQQAARRPAAGERLQIRVGLQVGEALRHDATDYFGTTVVVASRLCALAQAGEILCTSTVRALISDASAFDFRDRGELALKGIAAPVDACEVLYAHDPLAMLTVTPFVGRDEVIGNLTSKLEEARSGRGSLVLLVGEPGIGKTRTAEEFAAVARHKGATVLWGRCYDGEWAPPFSPFVEAIKEYAAATPPEALAAALGADAGVLARIVPALHERLPDIAEPPAIPAEGERYRLLDAASNLFAKIASGGPLVLLLDDLHWADKGTIAMLRQVARLAPAQALVIVGGYRDVELDRTHPLAAALADLRRETSFERIVLKGLATDDVGALLDVIAEQDVPRPLVDAIASETNGNPFFIKEVLLHLIEERKIVQEDGRWTSTLTIADMGIPEGVREVIGRRLSRLGAACNAMLTASSAMTGGFSWAELRAICEEPERALLDALDEALAVQVLVERERGTYDFTHALIRHTLYEELSTPRRVLLHRRIGGALEALYAADVEPHLAELAHHFFEAGEGSAGKAIDFCARAGDRAFASFAYDEAASQFERAQELAVAVYPADPAPRIELMLQLGRVRFACGSASMDTFLRAAELAKDAQLPELVIRAALREPDRSKGGYSPSATLWGAGDARIPPLLDYALSVLPVVPSRLRACALAFRGTLAGSDTSGPELVNAAEEMARGLGDVPTLLYVLLMQQWVLSRHPRLTERQLHLATEMLDLARQAQDLTMTRLALYWRSCSLVALADVAAFADIEAFHETSRQLRVPQLSWLSMGCLATVAILKGDYAEGERLAGDALRVGQTVSPDFWLDIGGDASGVANNFGIQLFQLRRDQGRLRELEPLVRNAIEQFPEEPAWRAALALVLFEGGDLSEAEASYSSLAVSSFEETLRQTDFVGITLPLLAELCASLGDTERAAAFYDLVLPYTGCVLVWGWTAVLGSADRVLGVLQSLLSDWEAAERHLRLALDLHERLGARPWLARTQLDYARMLLKRNADGDAGRACGLLEAALATAREIGMAKVAADCEALLASVS
jgi:class 3 adenylate cyclase/tetratricopeptide (TPR) repeat protein